MAKKVTVVKAPMVIAYWPDGSVWSGYPGAPLPEGLKEGEAERLADFFEEIDLPDEADDKKPAAKKVAASKSDDKK